MASKLLAPHLLFAFYFVLWQVLYIYLSLYEPPSPMSISMSDLGSFLANVNVTENVSARSSTAQVDLF